MRSSIVCDEYHRIIKIALSKQDNSEFQERLLIVITEILQVTHPYFLISTLTIISIYLLFAMISSVLSTPLICFTLVLFVLINSFLHATFFSSCLLISVRRVLSRRHCLFCQRLPMDYPITSGPIGRRVNEMIARMKSFNSFDSVMKKFLAGTIFLLSIVGLIFSLWFSLSIDTRLFDDELLPTDAHSIRSHMKSQIEEFDIGPIIMLTIPKPVPYDDERVRLAMFKLLEQCRNETRTNSFKMFWLDQENLDDIKRVNQPMELRITPFSRNDLLVLSDKGASTIQASRFYCQYRSVIGKTRRRSIC
jgi:hypothetical protein